MGFMQPPREVTESLVAAAAAANERIRTCHEVVSCPKCHAPVGSRCVRASRVMTRTGVFAAAAPTLKHPHRERWTRVQPDR